MVFFIFFFVDDGDKDRRKKTTLLLLLLSQVSLSAPRLLHMAPTLRRRASGGRVAKASVTDSETVSRI